MTARNRLAIMFFIWFMIAPFANAAIGIVASCDEKDGCRVSPMFVWAIGGQYKIRLAPATDAKDPKLLKQGHVIKTDSLTKLYRDPKSGEIRTEPQRELAFPLKSKELVAADAWKGMTFDFKNSSKAKATVSVPIEHFVAVLTGTSIEDAALELMQDITSGILEHPRKKDLIMVSLAIAAPSPRLKEWRTELVNKMHKGINDYRSGEGDPRQLEKRLQSGLEAMATYGLVFYEDRSEEEVQKQLASEYAQLKRGMAVAGALKKAEFHDAYLAKLDQIGLARWTQSEIAEGAANALRESAAQHHAKALELEKEGLLGRAFDEARIASERMPCDRALSEHFYTVRIEHVNKNMVPMTTQPEGTNRTILEQIVRELDGLGNGQNLDPIRIDYFKGRIEEGLRIDRTYLPLQLKRADFLLRIGDLTGAQKVVMEAERDFQLTKQDADAWLRMDASLAERKLTTQARSEKDVNEFFGLGKFVEALGTAEGGLKADPWNPKLLFNASKAAAVLREGAKAQNYARTYLQSANMACVSSDEDTATMISLFVDHKSRILEGPIGDNQYPHWISGKRYRIDEVAYDPLSGGFFQQVRTISSTKDGSTTSFRWDGFAVTSIASIRKNGNDKNASEIISSELEPKYRRGSVHMSEIGMKAGSYDDRLTYSLLYPNSPDFDPTLAEKYVKRTFTRGWAGNPFFHPFLWTGIFLFDLTYDDQGRLVEAKPTYPDNSRPRSPFSDVLHFRWDGNTNRLLNISGKRYSRTMKYDDLGRIVEEIITFEKSKGYIEYDYVGKSWKIKLAKISDNFFDKTERVVLFRDFSE